MKGDDAMANPVTPSDPPTPITPGEIGKINELLAAKLRKSDLQSEIVQQVLMTQGEALSLELLGVVCARVEAISNLIVRPVKVDRSRTPQQTLDATGRKQYVDKAVADAMPRGEGDNVDLYFFRPRPIAFVKGLMSPERLAAEFEFNGLKPDPMALTALNEEDPVFAEKHPNATQWRDAEGNLCFAAFLRWNGEPDVYVRRDDIDWYDNCVFGGVRK